MKKIFILMILSLLLINSVYACDSEIEVRANGILEVHTFITLEDVNTNLIQLPMVFVYDLKVNSDFVIDYTYGLNTLTLNIGQINQPINLEIIYLTDYFVSKSKDIWTIDYYPLFDTKLDNLKLILPKYAEIVSLSIPLENVSIKNNTFVISTNNIDSLKIDYTLNYKKSSKNNNNYLWYIFILLFIISGIIYKKKFFRKNKNKRTNTKEDLLLGLNENEQKIIKLLLQEQGLSQKNLALKLYLPKGTISRNIRKLKDKGYIELKSYGITNKIFLSKIFKK
jgi:uncharacterized membrane protein